LPGLHLKSYSNHSEDGDDGSGEEDKSMSFDVIIFLTTGCPYSWKTRVLEVKTFSAHLRRFFVQTKPLCICEKID
jgi:hypothetical protein